MKITTNQCLCIKAGHRVTIDGQNKVHVKDCTYSLFLFHWFFAEDYEDHFNLNSS